MLRAGDEVELCKVKEVLREAHETRDGRPVLLELVEAMCEGDLLEDRLEEWCEEERLSLRTAYVTLLRELTEISKAGGDIAKALEYARRVVKIEPLDEDARRELMILLHLAGKRAEALAQFEALRQLLKAELDVTPSDATLQAFLHIRSHRILEISGSSRVAHSDGGTSSADFDSMPLVGRADLASGVLRSIEDTAHGRGGAAVISGETGVGKTKFVEFIVTESNLRWFEVLDGPCPDLQNPRPYQVFVQALWRRMCESLQAEGTGTPLGALLRAFVSDSVARNPTNPGDVSPRTYDSAMIVEVFLSLLDARNSARPILLALEDIHRIDKASINLLITLLGRISKRKLFVLATIRSDESESRSLISQLIVGGAREIQLLPLNADEVEKLLRLALNSVSVARPVISYVWERSGGLPLFALEFLKYLQAEGMIVRAPDGNWLFGGRMIAVEASGEVPSRIQEIVRRRIESLDPAVKRILLTASVFSTE